MSIIHPVNNNGLYLTSVSEELIPIRCIKDYTYRFKKDDTYSYRLYKHNETNINIYVVYYDDSDIEPNYFTKDSLSKHFDITPIIREEKLNKLGI